MGLIHSVSAFLSELAQECYANRPLLSMVILSVQFGFTVNHKKDVRNSVIWKCYALYYREKRKGNGFCAIA